MFHIPALKRNARAKPQHTKRQNAPSVMANLVENEYRWCGLMSATCYPHLTYSAYLSSITTNNKYRMQRGRSVTSDGGGESL
jgi:hypothetical protein